MPFAVLPLHAQRFTLLYEFRGGTDGENPQAGLVRDRMGNLYGTTQRGGIFKSCFYTGPGCGTVFKLSPNGIETLLYRFTGMPDGEAPFANLIVDREGNLYGTTAYGGTSNYGVVFEIDTSKSETALYSFGAYPDGEYPFAGLVMDANGNIYGTTQEGGTETSCWGGCGTVFRLSPIGEETVLFSFAPPAESPTASLTLDTAGNLYGITTGGNSCCLGTLFALSKAGVVTTLYTFTGGTDGEGPKGGILRDGKGRFYGMTISGGDIDCGYGYGCGEVYELSPKGKKTDLHLFTGSPDGANPNAGLVRDRQGNFYGTTPNGGDYGLGTIFKLDSRNRLTVLHSFANADGATPYSTLIQDDGGNFYGTTLSGGDLACNPPYGCGVVFKITP